MAKDVGTIQTKIDLWVEETRVSIVGPRVSWEWWRGVWCRRYLKVDEWAVGQG